MIEFENISRLKVIQHCIKKTKCTSYLEIGCDKNQVFSKIRVNDKTGVDPKSGGTHRMTSDVFFSSYNKARVRSSFSLVPETYNQKSANTIYRDQKTARLKTYDVIFIDGLHHYNQVGLDVINSLRVLKPGGFIIIHDMLPVNVSQTIVPEPEKIKIWLGDVWKLSFDIIKSNDLDFKILNTDCGIGIIQTKDSFNPKKSFNEKSLKSNELSWQFYVDNVSSLPIVSAKSFLL